MPIEITPQFSKYFFAWLLFIYGGALFCIASTNLAFSIKLTITTVVIAHLINVIRRHLTLTHSQSVVAVSLLSNNNWKFSTSHGQQLHAVLSKQRIVTRYLIVLNFTNNNAKGTSKNSFFSLVLFPDSVATTVLRQLRYQLAQL